MEIEQMNRAVSALKDGRLVAFPTETVYGLGADATNSRAVRAIYEVKGRPSHNPLIVHVADASMAARYGKVTKQAEYLMDLLWPGALTLVLERSEHCPLSTEVSAGGASIALRCPAHPLAQSLIKSLGQGIAAPSANRSGRVSPTTAQHVHDELGNSLGSALAMILDDGPCKVGVESTVVDARKSRVRLLRPGSVTLTMLEEMLSHENVVDETSHSDDALPCAPGQLTSHYAPSLPVRMNILPENAPEGSAYLGFGAHQKGDGPNLSRSGNLNEAASQLFSLLRVLDDPLKYNAISVAPIPSDGVGAAINDRLTRASA